MLNLDERKKLHSKDYVDRFEKSQQITRLERLLDKVKLDSNFKVLDVGCGSGLIAQLICNNIDKYVGVDFSEEFISKAIKKNLLLSKSDIKFICSDIVEFCKNNKDAFDIAFAMDISEHVYDDEWINILKSVRESLRTGGKIYIHTPNRNFIVEQLKEKNILLKQFPEHISVRTPSENVSILHLAGFKQVNVEYVSHYNILKFLHIFSIIPVIGKYFKARLFINATK